MRAKKPRAAKLLPKTLTAAELAKLVPPRQYQGTALDHQQCTPSTEEPMSEETKPRRWGEALDRIAALERDRAEHVRARGELATRLGAAEQTLTALRVACVATLTDVGIAMLAAPNDPATPFEVESAIRRLAGDRDALRAHVAALLPYAESRAEDMTVAAEAAVDKWSTAEIAVEAREQATKASAAVEAARKAVGL